MGSFRPDVLCLYVYIYLIHQRLHMLGYVHPSLTVFDMLMSTDIVFRYSTNNIYTQGICQDGNMRLFTLSISG